MRIATFIQNVVITGILFVNANCKKQLDLNTAPVANAGPDQTIAFPTNTVMIVGSASTDPDNNITSYAWSKISGPPSFNILTANAVQTQVTNLVVGTYQFELKVTDAGGLFDKDTLLVTVTQRTTTTTVDVYVAGQQNDLPVYWKNGQAVQLDKQAQGFYGTSIAIVDSTVYVAGMWYDETNWQRSIAKYWNNGQGVTIGNNAAAGSIVVAGSDVYVAGWEWEGNHPVAKYWKNGLGVPLTDGTMDASASSIVVIGNDIYVAGYEGFAAKYWKNGQAVSLSNGTNQGYATSITVIGSDIYVAGSESNGTYSVAKYWKNGQSMPLTNGTKNASANSIVVVGNDVYVAGTEGDYYRMEGGLWSVAKYWKNGQEVSLTNGANKAFATSITVFDSDVYVAGREIIGSSYLAKYWKNGQEVLLASNAYSYSIVVVNR